VRDLAVLFLHLLATVARLAGPGCARSVVAESVLVKHQLLSLNRSRKRSPNLRASDRVVAGLCALVIRPGRLIRSAIVLKPSALLSLHRALRRRKYRRLFSFKRPMKPGPKGPSQDVIAAVVDDPPATNRPGWRVTSHPGSPPDGPVIASTDPSTSVNLTVNASWRWSVCLRWAQSRVVDEYTHRCDGSSGRDVAWSRGS
jgi:hypothetical protein